MSVKKCIVDQVSQKPKTCGMGVQCCITRLPSPHLWDAE